MITCRSPLNWPIKILNGISKMWAGWFLIRTVCSSLLFFNFTNSFKSSPYTQLFRTEDNTDVYDLHSLFVVSLQSSLALSVGHAGTLFDLKYFTFFLHCLISNNAYFPAKRIGVTLQSRIGEPFMLKIMTLF